MRLSELKENETAVIAKIKGRGAFRKRITEMGFVKGKEVAMVKGAPMKDPIEYEIMGYSVSLRKNEAKLVEIVTKEEAKELEITPFDGVIDSDILKKSAQEQGRNIKIALVGNPNCGKTTMYNYVSGSKERVGNYAGVTVDVKNTTTKHNGYKLGIADLPGTYSISAYTAEERYVRNYLFEELPDIVVNVVDASNLERNLFLTTQLIDMDIKVVLALNMYDELEKSGARFKVEKFAQYVGIPVVPTVASKGKGVKELFDKVIDVYEDRDATMRKVQINYGDDIEKSLQRLVDKVDQCTEITNRIAPRYWSLKMLEKDSDAANIIQEYAPDSQQLLDDAQKETKHLESVFGEDSETLIADAKYGFIHGIMRETYRAGNVNRREKTKLIDSIVTHKWLGIPVFIFFMWLTFQSTFSLGAYPMDWIDSLVGMLADFVSSSMSDGPLKDLIVDGIIGGVGGVIIFLPNILILFFFISLMEDTGYMARAAFIMDKVMHVMGLHGKSFIPLIMGFGCNVPAVMATRTLESRNDRLLTMLITPFMSCSARLPVYLLIAGAVMPDHAGTVLFGIYFSGIILAVLVAIAFKKIVFVKEEVPFVLELPPYRKPTLRNTLVHMWTKSMQYLKKMGGVILVASIIIWALSYFPQDIEYSQDYSQKITEVEQLYDAEIKAATNNEAVDEIEKQKTAAVAYIELIQEAERQEKSYLGQMGKAIEPVIEPLGFDWKMGVAILTGIAAKEIVVSTMGVLYHAEHDADETSETLMEKIRNQTYTSGDHKGELVFSPLVAFGFMLFILIYFPCVAVIAAIKKESGEIKWGVVSILFNTALAWVVAFGVYQVGSLFV